MQDASAESPGYAKDRDAPRFGNFVDGPVQLFADQPGRVRAE